MLQKTFDPLRGDRCRKAVGIDRSILFESCRSSRPIPDIPG